MSRRGDCWDNAVAESLFGSLKVEQVFGVQYSCRSAAKQELIEFIEMFCNSRRLQTFLAENTGLNTED